MNINKLHSRGKAVVCYINIGSWESWRDDADDFPRSALGNELRGWADERWLDITNPVRILAPHRLAQDRSLEIGVAGPKFHFMRLRKNRINKNAPPIPVGYDICVT